MKTRLQTLFLCFCSFLLVLAVTGCSSIAQESAQDTDGSASAEWDSKLQEVFPKDQVVDVKITIDEADFQDMLDNASAEEYKQASVNYNGHQFDNVAIRTKGNLSLRSVVSSDSDRYSFKISFDEYVNQTFNGISKINLNNNYSDASSMREFLAYELAESAGLPTPGYSYVNVYVNDELWGFYLAVEQVGDAYLERNFGSSYGALYKAAFNGQGSDLKWLGDDIDSYSGLVMKSEKSNNDILIDMLNELNNGTDYEKVLDVENALKYIALNVAVANMDSYNGSNKQNYYLYENEGIFSVLPWDYNMAFGGFGGSNILIDEPTQGALADRPLIAKLLAVDEYKERYHEILSEMINGYLNSDTLEKRVQELQTLISSHVKNDPRPFYSYEEYEAAVPSLISFAADHVQDITDQLNGDSPASGDGSGSGGGMGGRGGGGFPGRGQNMQSPNMNQNDGDQDTSNSSTSFRSKNNTRVMNTVQNGTGESTEAAPFSGGQMPEMPANGQMPEMPEGWQMPEMPANGQMPEMPADGQMPEMPEGWQMPDMPTQGQTAEMTTESQTTETPTDDQAADTSTEDQATETPTEDQAETPSQGQFPQMPANGEMPQMPEGGFGGFEGGFGGFEGGFGGQNAQQTQGNTKEAIYTGVALVLLLLSCLFVTLYKRKRL